MSVPLTIQGVTFQYPQKGDNNWGPTLTNWSTAVTNAISPLLSGGTIQVSPYPGAVVNFANATNSGFLPLAINGSNQLTFNGTPLATSGGGSVNPGIQYQLGYYAGAGTAISGLTLITPNKALESDANGLPIASSVSSTTLAFLDATSSVQTQLNTLSASISSVSTVANAALPKAGGTMSGAINMGSNKINTMAQGTVSGDAVAFPVAAAQIANNTITATQIANNTITATQIANTTITATQIANTTITATQIANATITGTQVANDISLPGSPTTSTQPVNTSTTQIATTAFVNPANSLTATGYQKLPSGLIMQWGPIPLTNGSGTAVSVSFTITFPTAVWSIQTQTANISAGNGHDCWHLSALSTSSFTVHNNDATTAFTGYYLAIGI